MKFIHYLFTLMFCICLSFIHGQSYITLLPKIQNDSMVIHARNNRDCPMFLVMEPTDKFPQKGVFAKKTVIPPNDTADYISRFPILSDKDISMQAVLSYFKFNITLGDPYKVKPDEDFKYTLPFLVGKRYQIIQAFNGKKSHNYDRSRYALDFNMSIGDTICAARSGIIVGVKEDSNKGGNSRKYQQFGNKIVVYHDDGTFAHYAHLKQHGALVNLGDRVEQGQPIGLSGNTGYSSGPHLHFVVRIPTEEGEVAIPIEIDKVKPKHLRRSHKMVKRKK